MLDFYFRSIGRMRQLREGPLAEHVDGLAAEFQHACYAETTARRMLSIIGQFNSYMRLVGLSLDEVDESTAERFPSDVFLADEFCQEGGKAMRHLLGYLRSGKVIAPPQPPPPHPFASTLDGFDRYLRDVRGLAQGTRRASVTSARVFIDWLRERYDRDALTRLAGTDVLEFITDRLRQYASRSSRSHVCSQTRGFLTQVRHYLTVYPVFEAKFSRFCYGKPVNTGGLLWKPVCRAIIII